MRWWSRIKDSAKRFFNETIDGFKLVGKLHKDLLKKWFNKKSFDSVEELLEKIEKRQDEIKDKLEKIENERKNKLSRLKQELSAVDEKIKGFNLLKAENLEVVANSVKDSHTKLMKIRNHIIDEITKYGRVSIEEQKLIALQEKLDKDYEKIRNLY